MATLILDCMANSCRLTLLNKVIVISPTNTVQYNLTGHWKLRKLSHYNAALEISILS